MIKNLVVCCLALICSVSSCGYAQSPRTVRAEGMGMSPTIRDGDRITIDRRSYERSPIDRFDIIAFLVSSDKFHYKRVIGLPKEKIEMRNGQVFINDVLINEPFEKMSWNETNLGPLVIPEDEYFVLGDNRPNSADSRIWNPPTIKRKDVLGKIVEIDPVKE